MFRHIRDTQSGPVARLEQGWLSGSFGAEGHVGRFGGWETEFPRPMVFQRRDGQDPASFEWGVVGLQYRNHASYDRTRPNLPDGTGVMVTG